jgi:hypothetical protein
MDAPPAIAPEANGVGEMDSPAQVGDTPVASQPEPYYNDFSVSGEADDDVEPIATSPSATGSFEKGLFDDSGLDIQVDVVAPQGTPAVDEAKPATENSVSSPAAAVTPEQMDQMLNSLEQASQQ